MNREDIIRMAWEAGIKLPDAPFPATGLHTLPDLIHFAALVAAAEREACGQIADAEASIEGIAQRIAAAIRARGDT